MTLNEIIIMLQKLQNEGKGEMRVRLWTYDFDTGFPVETYSIDIFEYDGEPEIMLYPNLDKL